jgi:4-carboxymuconolactone decarboxylase
MKDNSQPPPRLAPLAPEELGPDAMDVIAGVMKAQSKPSRGDVPAFIAIMLRYPELFRRQADLSAELFSGALPFRDVELVLLRTTWICQAPFIFGEHVKTAKANCGFTSADIERIIEGSGAEGWDEHSRALLKATEELIETSTISDETWAALAKTLDEKQLIELPILVAHKQGVAYVQNALRAPLMQGNEGLSAR